MGLEVSEKVAIAGRIEHVLHAAKLVAKGYSLVETSRGYCQVANYGGIIYGEKHVAMYLSRTIKTSAMKELITHDLGFDRSQLAGIEFREGVFVCDAYTFNNWICAANYRYASGRLDMDFGKHNNLAIGREMVVTIGYKQS